MFEVVGMSFELRLVTVVLTGTGSPLEPFCCFRGGALGTEGTETIAFGFVGQLPAIISCPLGVCLVNGSVGLPLDKS